MKSANVITPSQTTWNSHEKKSIRPRSRIFQKNSSFQRFKLNAEPLWHRIALKISGNLKFRGLRSQGIAWKWKIWWITRSPSFTQNFPGFLVIYCRPVPAIVYLNTDKAYSLGECKVVHREIQRETRHNKAGRVYGASVVGSDSRFTLYTVGQVNCCKLFPPKPSGALGNRFIC